MVPNGATSDNRVVREAESLKRAGHEVLLVGLRLNDMPGRKALTAGGVPVRRIDWQYRAYSSLVIVYALLIAPVMLVVVVLLFGALNSFYFGTLEQSMARTLDWLGTLFNRDGGSVVSLKEQDPFLYHSLILALLGGVVLMALLALLPVARVLRRLSNRIATLTGVTLLMRAARVAGNINGAVNGNLATSAESISSTSNPVTSFLREKLPQKYIARARQRGFVEVGLEFGPDIIQCHEVICLPAAIELKRAIRCRVIYEAHEIYDELANASENLSKGYKRIHQACLPHIDGFITVNPLIGNYFRDTYSYIPEPVIVPNSVVPKNVAYDGRLHDAAGLPRNAKILLYQGGFSPKRGMEILIEAAFRLPYGWYVVFMGRGPLEQTLRERALYINQKIRTDSANGFESEASMKVRFVPMASHSELAEWTSGATVGIIPYENFGLNHWFCSPNKIWEYPNAGVPFIASRLAFLSETIERWGIGWTISSDPKSSDIVAVVRAITDESLAERKRACARFIAAENYLLHEARLLDLFASLSPRPQPAAKA